ncbi:MAG: hypothetical protein KDK78_01050 [Chlamydiia bacterium]|nr:hypothetical protein [Chlamydiia bacterium]
MAEFPLELAKGTEVRPESGADRVAKSGSLGARFFSWLGGIFSASPVDERVAQAAGRARVSGGVGSGFGRKEQPKGLGARAWSWMKSWMPGPSEPREGESSLQVRGPRLSSAILGGGLRWYFDPKPEIDHQKKRVEHFFGSSVVGNMIHMAARSGRDLLIHELRYPQPENHDNPHWTQELGLSYKHPTRFGSGLRWLTENQSSYVQEELEAVVGKLGANIANRLYSLEQDKNAEIHRPNMVLDYVIDTLAESIEHLKTVNAAKKKHGPKVHDTVMIGEFGDARLHPAISADDGLLHPNVRIRNRMEGMYRPLAKRLLAQGFPKGADDMPTPYGSRQEMWFHMNETIAPEVLRSAFEELLNPRTLHAILLECLKQLNAPGAGKDVDPEIYAHDPRQRLLKELSGDLLAELAENLDPTLGRLLFKIPTLQDRLGEMMALKIRDKLDNEWTLAHMINKGCFAALPNWIDGHWEDAEGNIVEEYRVGNDLVFIPDGRGEFKFARDAHEVHSEKVAKAQRAHEDAQEIGEQLRILMKDNLKSIIPDYIKRKWVPVNRWVDDIVLGYFGRERGRRVKAKIDSVAGGFFKALKKVVVVATWPVWKTAEILLDRYIRGLHESVLRESHRKVHESLLYKRVDAFVDLLAPRSKTFA